MIRMLQVNQGRNPVGQIASAAERTCAGDLGADHHGGGRVPKESALGAFTLMELVVLVAVLSIIALVAVSRFDTGAVQAEAAARNFLADAAYAQAAAIARPDLGCLIRVDSTTQAYWLARKASPASPMTNPVTQKPYLVQLGASNEYKLNNVKIGTVSFGGDNDLMFDAFGGVDQASAASIDFAVGSVVWRVTIDPITGVPTASRMSN